MQLNSSHQGPPIGIRPATREDFPAIGQVCLATGQHPGDSGVSPSYLSLLLATGETLVATQGSRLVGWGATKATAFGSLLTDLFVDPSSQGLGVGRALLDALWPRRSAPRFTFSSQDPRALPVYARTGLLASWPLLYLRGDPSTLPMPRCRVSFVSPQDAAAAEASFSGMSRVTEYQHWARSDASPFLIHSGPQLVAAGALGSASVLRLAVADPGYAAEALVAALQGAGSGASAACVPGIHPALGTLLAAGFRVEDYDFHMCTPGLSLPRGWAYSPGLA